MKKQPTINFSWPASLSDFSKDTAHENFTRCRLRVFYKGETADHRYFSDSFCEELIKSLPYTPVVSYYDEEKDDFVGHATEQQILGIVDPLVTPVFESYEDGKTWAVCDVVLYTERPDRVGDIAKKIEGHSQSLELNPSTVKYTVNYDEKRHFKNIEFTAGSFVGVSVLGSEQKPAFTGSEFFTLTQQFEDKMKILREYCESKAQHGGKVMDLQEFMKLSWGDISSQVNDALFLEYESEAYTQIVDMYPDCAIVRFYSYIDGSNKLMRVCYSVDEGGKITLGNVNEVHVVYEDIVTTSTNAELETGVEQTTASSIENAEKQEEEENDEEDEEDPDKEKENCELPKKEEEDNPPAEEKTDEEDDDDEDDKEKKSDVEKCSSEDVVDAAISSTADDAAQVSNAEVTAKDEKASVENENIESKETSGSTAFAESQRAELEELKREKKVTLLDSYKQYLTEEEFNDFSSRIDEFSNETLELELLKKYKRKSEEDETPTMRAFTLCAPNKSNGSKKDALDAFVKKYR